MDIRFRPHNTHLDDPASFRALDPQLRQLERQPLVHTPPLLARLPREKPGIYSVSGGRQVGKTTLLKLWMADLLDRGTAPGAIGYLTGELIDDHHALLRLLQDFLADQPKDRPCYLVLDEVTYTRDWDKGVKFAADAGQLERAVLMITGSDLAMVREARSRLPGRRGDEARVDFHLYPLSFRELVELKDPGSPLLDDEWNASPEDVSRLTGDLERYLIHGGYLTAINDMAREDRVRPSTLAIYSDWIRGDMIKRGKQEPYLREILGAIVTRYGSQVTWNSLAGDLSIDHHRTVADYIRSLESLDAVYVQAALMEDRLVAAPKKARKVIFTDPFVLHAVRAWLQPTADPASDQIRPLLADPAWTAKIVEACVANHFRRWYPTYYIKAAREVDVAYVDRGRFWPVEVKWTTQLRPKDLKQICKYENGLILARVDGRTSIRGVPVEPLPLALLQMREPGRVRES